MPNKRIITLPLWQDRRTVYSDMFRPKGRCLTGSTKSRNKKKGPGTLIGLVYPKRKNSQKPTKKIFNPDYAIGFVVRGVTTKKSGFLETEELAPLWLSRK